MKKHMLRSASFLMAFFAAASFPFAVQAEGSQTWSTRLLGEKGEFSIGAALRLAPRYQGADSYRGQPLPVFSAQRGIFFADSNRGAGLQFQTDSGFYVSQSVYYDFGRVERNSSLRPGSRTLSGMGDVPDSVTTRTLVMQQVTSRFSVNAEAEFALESGARRNRYRLGAEYRLLKDSTDEITFSGDIHAGDQRYNQAYFGVTPAQSARTRFAAFKAVSGVSAYALGAGWSHAWDSHWTTSLQITAMRYVDKVASSPLIANRTSVTGDAAVIYTF